MSEEWKMVEIGPDVFLIECKRGILGSICKIDDLWRITVPGIGLNLDFPLYLMCFFYLKGVECAARAYNVIDRMEKKCVASHLGS